jgi:hypothetical protein
MATIYKNSGLILAMQSAIAAATAIDSATNAAPGVFSATGHGLLDGDIVLIRASGMIEVNERMFAIVNKATDTFQLRSVVTGSVGIDTTSYGVFSSGTFEKITLGTTLSGVQAYSPQGGEIKFLDNTTVSDTRDKQITNGTTAMSYGLTLQWDPSDPAQAAMNTASETSQSRGFRIRWPNGRYMLFYGSVGFSGAPGGDNQGITTTQAAIAMNGAPTYAIP